MTQLATRHSQVYGLEWLPIVADRDRAGWEEYAARIPAAHCRMLFYPVAAPPSDRAAPASLSPAQRSALPALYGSAAAVSREHNISGDAFFGQVERGIYEFAKPLSFEDPVTAQAGRAFYVPAWQARAGTSPSLRCPPPPARPTPRPASRHLPPLNSRSLHTPTHPYPPLPTPPTQAFPLAPNWFILMFDLHSQEQRAELIRRVLSTGEQATSDIIYLVEASTPIPASFILTPVVAPQASGRAGNLQGAQLCESSASGVADGASPFLHAPSNSTVVGFAGVLFLWQTVLARALPDHLSGIVAAVVSPSGAAHTFQLHGGSAVSLGQGLRLNGTFRSHERKLQADVTSDTWQARRRGGCLWFPPSHAAYSPPSLPEPSPSPCPPPGWPPWVPQLWVYPTDELLQAFLTKEPMLRGAFVMAMVFIASLILHSWVLLRRSQRLSTIFRATDNLVDDVRGRTKRTPILPD